MIGEEWGYATPWLLGRDFDSVMNYRFRGAVLNWLFDSCQGQGCENGAKFSDGDSNDGSPLGSIHAAPESEFLDQLGSIAEDTPPQSWHAMMNLVGSHDTSRILWVLKKISRDSAEVARRKLALLALFQLTYPGAPTIYYGDEAGLSADDVWRGGGWVDDPYNRLTYPWKDQGGAGGDARLLAYYSALARARMRIPALRSGGFEPVQVDDGRRTLVFVRETQASRAWVALNRGLSEQPVSFVSPKLGPDGTTYTDALSGESFVVRRGTLSLGGLAPLAGRILVKN
jgi:glycosidase